MAPGGSEIEGRKLMAEVVPNTLQGDQLYTESALHPGESRDLDLFFWLLKLSRTRSYNQFVLDHPPAVREKAQKLLLHTTIPLLGILFVH